MTWDKTQPYDEVGDNVTIPIPDVDKAKGNRRNIVGVVPEKNKYGTDKIGTKYSVFL